MVSEVGSHYTAVWSGVALQRTSRQERQSPAKDHDGGGSAAGEREASESKTKTFKTFIMGAPELTVERLVSQSCRDVWLLMTSLLFEIGRAHV